MTTPRGRSRTWSKGWRTPKSQTFPQTVILTLAFWSPSADTWDSPTLLSSAGLTHPLWRLLFPASLLLWLSQDPAGYRNTVAAVTAALGKILDSLGQSRRAWVERENTRVHAHHQGAHVYIKIEIEALAGVAQWIERWPANQKVTGSIPSWGTCLGCGPMFLPLSFSLPSTLPKK